MTTSQTLWHLLRYRGWWLGLSLLISFILYGLTVTPGVIAREIFDHLTNAAPAQLGLWSLVALYALSAVARQTMYCLFILSSTLHRHLIFGLLRGNLLEQILHRPGAQALPVAPGEAISRFRDDVGSLASLLGNGFHLVSSAFQATIAAVILLRTDPWLTVLVFAPLVLVMVLVNRSRQRIIHFRTAEQSSTAQVTGALGEFFGAAQALKVAGAEERAIGHLHKLNATRRQAAIKARLFNETLNTLADSITELGSGLILLLMAQAMRRGDFTVGDFALFVFFLPWAGNLANAVGWALTAFRQWEVSLARLRALLPTSSAEALVRHRPVDLRYDPPPLPSQTNRARPPLVALTVTGLTYTYPDSDHGIQNINLQLPRGSCTVITGRIGAGKSTLLRVLLGLLPKDEGEIRWNGAVLADPATFFTPPVSAYTPQTPRLFSDPLIENILLGLPTAQVDLPGAIRQAVLESDVAQMPDGLNTLIGSRGVRLSGGQIQRTAAARMFVRTPELLVFDDLSSALDVETEQLLWERLFDITANRSSPEERGVKRERPTCLIVSHRPAALQRADLIIVLKAGRIEDQGRLDELLTRCTEMQQLWYGSDR